MNHRNILQSLVLCLITTTAIHAQYDWEVQANFNAFFGGKIQFVEGDLKVGNGLSTGLSFQREVGYGRKAGLVYSYTGTDLTFNPARFYENDYPRRTEDMGIHQIYFNGTQQLVTDGPVSPFVDIGFGMIIYDIKPKNFDDGVRFLVNLGLGAKIDISDQFGLKVNGSMKMPIVGSGAGLWCGWGPGGTSCGLSTYGSVLLLLWEAGGGVYYKF